MTTWLQQVFGTDKPIIAMCHLMALPGDPGFDPAGGMQAVVERARRDLRALHDGGVDAVLFSNEFSLPYLTRVETVTVASMARVIAELLPEVKIPFGVDVLWDARASLDLAVATGAAFVREVFSGAYASDFGLWTTDFGEVARHRQAIGAQDVRLLFNIVPEAAAYLGARPVTEIARSTVFNAQPDALCVSGLTAGVETSLSTLTQVKQAVPQTPVFANTGVRPSNVREQLAIADGAVVGTTFKVDGVFTNPVDARRVSEFMAIVRAGRRAGG
jgi:membrane complex biogenesis BtpA family protein